MRVCANPHIFFTYTLYGMVPINILQPILYQELKNGDLDPWVYASMLDHIRMVSQVESPFPYYGTYITNKSIQTIENLDEILHFLPHSRHRNI
jgi:hypothetical protein